VYGEKKRATSFNLAKESERAMYQYSMSINFSEFVKRSLAAEMKRKSKSSIQVNLGE